MSLENDLLLHPELLSNQQLLNIIRERHLKLPALEHMSRENLLEIFHHYCVPHAQRRYRDTGRGKMLNKTRNIADISPNKQQNGVCKMDTTDYRDTAEQECKNRLRPPPDFLSSEIKRIKLSNGVERRHAEVNVNKRTIEFSNKDTSNGTPPEKKIRKPITWP